MEQSQPAIERIARKSRARITGMVLERIENLRVILRNVQRETNGIAARTTGNVSRHEERNSPQAEQRPAAAERRRRPGKVTRYGPGQSSGGVWPVSMRQTMRPVVLTFEVKRSPGKSSTVAASQPFSEQTVQLPRVPPFAASMAPL